MSNRITFTPTDFVNRRSGQINHGFRAYDNYAQTYDNTWDSIPDDDMEFLQKVTESPDSIVQDMLDYIGENGTGVEIDNMWYEWDEIEHILKKSEHQESKS